jgi:Zn-dependent protease with chaperone function
MRLYIKDRDEGPYSKAEIIEQVKYAGLSASTLVRVQGQDDWVPVSSMIDENNVVSVGNDRLSVIEETRQIPVGAETSVRKSSFKTGYSDQQADAVQYTVDREETFYLALKCMITLAMVVIIALVALYETQNAAGLMVFVLYAFLIYLYQILVHSVAMGHLKGNGIRVTEEQFPEIHRIVAAHSRRLRLDSIPLIYIIQAGGVLNAFATRFVMKNYIVLYSDIVETAYDKGPDALSFIIGHELGHVKRRHIIKNTWLFPSVFFFFPFFQFAYSRACEYTCDNIGAALSPDGATDGILILSAGKRLYSKVNIARYIKQSDEESGFWTWFAERLCTHPHTPKRIKNISRISGNNDRARLSDR